MPVNSRIYFNEAAGILILSVQSIEGTFVAQPMFHIAYLDATLPWANSAISAHVNFEITFFLDEGQLCSNLVPWVWESDEPPGLQAIFADTPLLTVKGVSKVFLFFSFNRFPAIIAEIIVFEAGADAWGCAVRVGFAARHVL